MNIGIRVTCSAYLENGTLIMGGESISKWMTDRWPFEEIIDNSSLIEPVDCLLALPGNCFASGCKLDVLIWSFDMKLLNKFKMNHSVVELIALLHDVFLIRSNYDALICNHAKWGDFVSN
jgi:hypothetical protein